MTTWAQLLSQTQLTIDDSSGMIHSSSFLQTHLEYSELLFVLTKGWYEVTASLSLLPNTPTYDIASNFPDFIFPLRMSIGGVALNDASLQSLSMIDSDWYTHTGDPDFYYMTGSTRIGFYPITTSPATVSITYLAVPPQGIVDTSLSPKIQQQYHTSLPHYAAALALAREGKMNEAIIQLKAFVEVVGHQLDRRLVAQMRQMRKEQNENVPIRG